MPSLSQQFIERFRAGLTNQADRAFIERIFDGAGGGGSGGTTITNEDFNPAMTFDVSKTFNAYAPSGTINLTVDDPSSATDIDCIQKLEIDTTSLTDVTYEASKFYLLESSQYSFADIIAAADTYQIWFSWDSIRARVYVSIFKISVLS